MNWIILLFLFAQAQPLPLPSTLAPAAKVVKLAQLTGDQTPFAEGTTTAPNGDVYFTDQNNRRAGASGVTVVDPKSWTAFGFVPVPERPANVAFGGRDHRTPYIAARTGFYSVETNVRGANPAK
jgi:gluconolactonase